MPAAKRHLLITTLAAFALSACQGQASHAQSEGPSIPAEGSAPQKPGEFVAGPPVAAHDRQGRSEESGKASEVPRPSSGTITGTVQDLQLAEGTLTLSTDEGNVTIHAQPADIAHVHPGDMVHLAYRDYEGVRWLTPQRDLAQEDVHYGRTITMAGNISGVDKRRGVISIGPRTVRAHPVQIEKIIPGQFMTLHYAQVGGEDWLTRVSPHMPKDEADDDEPDVMGD